MKIKLVMAAILTVAAPLCRAQEVKGVGNVAESALEARSEFIRLLNEKADDIETIACGFTQERKAAVLAKTVVKTGTFLYKKNGMMRLTFDDGDEILMNGESFRVTTAGKSNTMNMNSNPMLKHMGAILSACMTGNAEALTAGSDMELAETEGEYLLTINTGKRKERKYIKAFVLRFDKQDMTLNELRLEEPSGDYTMYKFSGKKFNTEIQDSLFEIL